MKTQVIENHMNSIMYLKIFIALTVLTILTFIQPYIVSGTVTDTVLIQLFIASIKTTLIVAYYMHLKYETKLFRYIVLMAVVTLGIFFVITASDAIFRNESFDLFQIGG